MLPLWLLQSEVLRSQVFAHILSQWLCSLKVKKKNGKDAGQQRIRKEGLTKQKRISCGPPGWEKSETISWPKSQIAPIHRVLCLGGWEGVVRQLHP